MWTLGFDGEVRFADTIARGIQSALYSTGEEPNRLHNAADGRLGHLNPLFCPHSPRRSAMDIRDLRERKGR